MNLKELRCLLLVLLPFIIIHLMIISQFKQFPGPIYGGDIYWHYGETLNIYNGALPIENPQVSGEYAYYGWLSQLLIADTAKIIGLNLKAIYLYSPIFFVILLGFAAYFLGQELFNNRKFAFILCLLFIIDTFNYTALFIGLEKALLVLFFLFFLKAIKTKQIKYKLLTGIFYGLASLVHVAVFPALSIFLLVFFIYLVFKDCIKFKIDIKNLKIKLIFLKEYSLWNSLKKATLFLLPIFTLGTLVAMLFFGPILYIYHGKILNPVNIYTEPDLTKYGLDVFFSLIEKNFFGISMLLKGDLISFIYTIFILFGLYALIVTDMKESKILLILVLSSFIAGFHYFLTIPLVNFSVIPKYLFSRILLIAKPLLFVFAIFILCEKRKEWKQYILLLTSIFIIILSVSSIYHCYYNQWTKVGRSQPNPVYDEIADWVVKNTDRNSVFLSTEELSFALNSLTARKIVISRRTHFSPYLDIDKRIAEAYIILYGNNTQKVEELLKKYNISYLYWDANWLYFAKYEPPLTNPKYTDYLSEYGVKFKKVYTYLDPAWEPMYPKYDLLAVIPINWSVEQPWSNILQKRLKLLRTFYIDNKVFAKIYKIQY